MPTVFLVVSSLIQLAAAWQALRLLRVAPRRRVWSLFTIALTLMAARRLVSLGLGADATLPPAATVTEMIALCSSVLLLAGVVKIGRDFAQAVDDAATVRRTSDELAAGSAEQRDNLERLVRQRTALLRESEATFRALAEHSHDVIMRFDRECRHLYASPIVERQTGIPAAAFIGKTHEELGFPRDLVAVWERAIRGVFASRSADRIEFELPNGIWIDWLLIPELAEDGEVRSVLTTARDITERKRAESELEQYRSHLEELVASRTEELRRANAQLQDEIGERERAEKALRESEERVHSLYDNVSIGLYRTTPDGRVILANPALARMLGYSSAEELMEKDLERDDVYRDLGRQGFKRMVHRDGKVEGLETTWVRRDGQPIVVRENATLVRDERDQVVYYEGTVEDVTERRRLEDQLRQAQRLEALGHLAGGIAHDFNNILMAVLGSTELVRRRVPSDDAVNREFAVIEQAVRRGSELTRGLLTFARRQVLEPSDLDLNATIEDLLPMLRRVIPESIEIVFIPGNAVGTIRVERGSLDQVLLNLSVNARDAMAEGGTITIRTAAGPAAAPGDGERSATAPRTAILVFSDSGIGMDPVTLSHIFEPFYSTKEAGRGTGMGLATVYGIVSQHGGTITADSEPGHGTTFTIVFPAIDGSAPQAAPTEEGTVIGGGEAILVVEDEAEVRRILVEVLRGFGYLVVEAEDGVEALDLLRREGERIDLILTDVIMPRMGGKELAEAARDLAPRAAFIFSSGYAPDLERLPTSDDIATGFIAKPYSIETLGRKVREVLDQRQR